MTDSTPSPLGVPHRVAAALCLLEGAVLVGLTGFYVYELALGQSQDLTLVLMSMALMLVVAVALIAAANAWRTARRWPRTPTVLWNVLLLPVAYSMGQAGFWGAWPLAAVAVTAIAAALTAKGLDAPAND